jgi:hypothetical protein
MLSFALGDDFLLNLFLILNEFDVCDLLLWWRRNQEEKGQDKDRDH